MEVFFLSFSMAIIAALFMSKHAKQLENEHNKTTDNANKKSKNYERFISGNKKSDDFLDYSGGLLGI